VFPRVRKRNRSARYRDHNTRKRRTLQLFGAPRENTRASFAPGILRHRRFRGSRSNTAAQLPCKLPQQMRKSNSSHLPAKIRAAAFLPEFGGERIDCYPLASSTSDCPWCCDSGPSYCRSFDFAFRFSLVKSNFYFANQVRHK